MLGAASITQVTSIVKSLGSLVGGLFGPSKGENAKFAAAARKLWWNAGVTTVPSELRGNKNFVKIFNQVALEVRRDNPAYYKKLMDRKTTPINNGGSNNGNMYNNTVDSKPRIGSGLSGGISFGNAAAGSLLPFYILGAVVIMFIGYVVFGNKNKNKR